MQRDMRFKEVYKQCTKYLHFVKEDIKPKMTGKIYISNINVLLVGTGNKLYY